MKTHGSEKLQSLLRLCLRMSTNHNPHWLCNDSGFTGAIVVSTQMIVTVVYLLFWLCRPEHWIWNGIGNGVGGRGSHIRGTVSKLQLTLYKDQVIKYFMFSIDAMFITWMNYFQCTALASCANLSFCQASTVVTIWSHSDSFTIKIDKVQACDLHLTWYFNNVASAPKKVLL